MVILFTMIKPDKNIMTVIDRRIQALHAHSDAEENLFPKLDTGK